MMSAESPSIVVPKGPTTGSKPSSLTASIAATTWGPGRPTSNGSTKNSALHIRDKLLLPEDATLNTKTQTVPVGSVPAAPYGVVKRLDRLLPSVT